MSDGIEALTADVRNMRGELATLRSDNRDDHLAILARLDRINGRVGEHDRCITQIQERQRLWHGVQAVYTTAIAAIMGYLGINR